MGQAFCNKFDITDAVLFYETDDSAINMRLMEYVGFEYA